MKQLIVVALLVGAVGCSGAVESSGEPPATEAPIDSGASFDAAPAPVAVDAGTLDAAPAMAEEPGPTVDSVTCSEHFGGGLGITGNFVCGTHGIYTVTLGNGEVCDGAHKPHACPPGTPCVVSGGDVAIVGFCE